MPAEATETVFWVWRHPRPEGAAGLCVGARSDLPVHWRRAKRLARRIQQHARRHQLPHIVHSSPLRRCAAVGAWLKRWGWRLHIDPALAEIDFGSWDGLPWSRIDKAAVDAWVADFARYRPGQGESLQDLLQRVAAWPAPPKALVISHGGWMLARRWTQEHGSALPDPAEWPRAPAYGRMWRLEGGAAGRLVATVPLVQSASTRRTSSKKYSSRKGLVQYSSTPR